MRGISLQEVKRDERKAKCPLSSSTMVLYRHCAGRVSARFQVYRIMHRLPTNATIDSGEVWGTYWRGLHIGRLVGSFARITAKSSDARRCLGRSENKPRDTSKLWQGKKKKKARQGEKKQGQRQTHRDEAKNLILLFILSRIPRCGCSGFLFSIFLTRAVFIFSSAVRLEFACFCPLTPLSCATTVTTLRNPGTPPC